MIEAVNNTNCFGGQVQTFRLYSIEYKATKYVLQQQSEVE